MSTVTLDLDIHVHTSERSEGCEHYTEAIASRCWLADSGSLMYQTYNYYRTGMGMWHIGVVYEFQRRSGNLLLAVPKVAQA